MVYKKFVSNVSYLHYFFHIGILFIFLIWELLNAEIRIMYMLPLKLASCSIVIVGLGTRPIASRDSAGPATCLSDLIPTWQLVVVRLVS